MEKTMIFDFWLSNQNILQVFDWQSVFNNSNPVEIDLGAGDGGFILAEAARRPEINFVAVERLLGRARKIAKRAVRENKQNVRVLRLESHYFLKWMCLPASIQAIHILFPDPWPKRKHHPRRLIQPDFIQSAHQALQPGGIARFTTDHADYFAWTCRLWNQAEGWEILGEWDASQEPLSDFQKDFLNEGRLIYRASWKKSGSLDKSS
ncbi:MAG: tRNA (guanosine(46)-N7)-methyltransferase TrmB [Verrucomicrobiota bacterium]